ncbi:MAG: hypothetical protein Q8M06_11040, partial [Methanobacteriaceae archaeon]|nr:hypothetical protein [Methanobacteriaceae archaeon]
ILAVNLILAKELFALDIPLTLNHLLNDSSSVKIAKYIKNIIFMKKSLNIFEKFYLDLIKRDSFEYGIKDCLSGLTRPTSCDYSDLPLPERFFTFYFLIRPLLLLRRYGKNSINLQK